MIEKKRELIKQQQLAEQQKLEYERQKIQLIKIMKAKVNKIESKPVLKKVVVKRYRVEKDGTKTLISSEPLGINSNIVVLDRQVRRVTTPDGRTKKIITRRL